MLLSLPLQYWAEKTVVLRYYIAALAINRHQYRVYLLSAVNTPSFKDKISFYPAKYGLEVGTVGTAIDYDRNKVGTHKLGSIDLEH